MDSSLRRALRKLIRLKGVEVAVLSGRGMTDLREKTRLPGLLLFSNHGLHASRRSLAPPAGMRRRWRDLARRARARLEPLLPSFPGARLEDKGLDLALHMRELAGPSRGPLALAVRRALKGLPVALRAGKLALEIRPPGPENKGGALVKLLRDGAPASCLFAGDDATDEDAFRALRPWGHAACGIKIGAGPSAARARLARARLIPLLKRLLSLLMEDPRHGTQ